MHLTEVEAPLTDTISTFGVVAHLAAVVLVAGSGATEVSGVPEAVDVVAASIFVSLVFVEALSATVVDSPFALAGVASARSGVAETVARFEACGTIPEAR